MLLRGQSWKVRMLVFRLLALVCAAGCSGCATADHVTLIPLRGNIQTAMSEENGSIVVDIVSTGGIGSARMVATDSRDVILRFRLRGLEELRVMTSDSTWVITVSSAAPDSIRQVLTAGAGLPATLRADDPLWISVKAVPGREKMPPSLFTSGFYQIILPVRLADSRRSGVLLSWVDFFR